MRNTQHELDQTDKIVAAHNSKALDDVIQRLVIPEFKLEQATLREAVTKLGQATIAHDNRELADNSKGIKFVIAEQSIRKTTPEALKTAITVDLRHTSTSELLRLITQFVGITYKVETFAVKLVPLPKHKQARQKVDNMGPSDAFLKGHLKLQESRRLEDQQDYKAANLRLAEAIELYDSIARNWPEWQKEMVEKRRQKLRQDRTNLKVKALASRKTVPAAINNKGRGFLEVVDSSWSDDDTDINPQTPEEERDANEAEKRRWEAMKRHVAELIIPEFSVKNVTLKEAIEKLKTLSVTHDKPDVPKDWRGVNILIDDRKIKRSIAKQLTKTFSIQADQAPIKTLLDYIMKLTDLQYRVEPYAVVIIPSQDTPPTLIEEPPAVDHSEKLERKKETGGPSTSMRQAMDQITIPSFNHYVTLEEAVSLLEKAAKANDRRDLPEAQKGIKFSIDKKGFAKRSPELLTRKVNHNYWDSPLSGLLELVCGPSATYKAVDGQIMVIPSLVSSRPRTDLLTRRYHYDLPSRHRKGGAKTILQKAGILFSKESTAFFIPSKNELVVRLPKEQFKLVDAWVNALK